MLDRSILRELSTLGEKADTVALHLVAAAMLIDEDPTKALAHARVAREKASRLATVREAAGIVAYQAGVWEEAIRDLRAARRMSGDQTQLPVIADCERALGRPERAIELMSGPEIAGLAEPIRAECAIVHSGARRDLGEKDSAIYVLEAFGLEDSKDPDVQVRLWYAYADALLEADRKAEAREWFGKVAALDSEQITDAAERVASL
ncbi:MAG: hypothetical protein ABI137_10565 [Antricoccus sp.]